MKLFQFVRKFYQNIGIDLAQSNQECLFNAKNILPLLCQVQMFISAFGAFLFQVKSISDYGMAFYASITGFAMANFFAILISNRPTIYKLIRSFEEFIDKRAEKYTETAAKIDQMTHFMHIILVQVTSVGILIPAIVITTVNYFVYNLGDRSYFLAYPMLMPFEWRSPFGYAVALFLQVADVSTVLYCATLLFAFFIGSCWLCIVFVNDVASDLSLMNFGNASDENNGHSNSDDRLVKRRFFNTVQYYSDVKQFVSDLNKIHEFIITGYFLWALLGICSSLLVLFLQLSEDDLNPIVLITSAFLAFWAFVLIFIFCECGERVAHEFNKFHENLCQCHWYKFPHDLQRMLVIVMIDTQQPAIIRGFANAVCTRNAFKKTTNAGFSYFMMLHHIDG